MRAETPRVTLPSSPAAAAPAQAERSALVVEDDQDVQLLLQAHLRQLGWSVQLVSSGEEALAVAAARTPDLVVVDILLPGIGGWDVVRGLRLDPATRGCTVVVTSVLDGADLEELAVDAVLPKPFSRSDVRRVLGSVPALAAGAARS